MPLSLRDATVADGDLLLAWRNDPVARQSSFQKDEVDEASHRRWFAAKLDDRERTRIWIVTEEEVPVGQIRYERKDHVAEISISVAASFRGRGFAAEILRVTAPRACREFGVHAVCGLVKLSNRASMAAFERAGFGRGEDTIVNGDPAAVFVWKCERS